MTVKDLKDVLSILSRKGVTDDTPLTMEIVSDYDATMFPSFIDVEFREDQIVFIGER